MYDIEHLYEVSSVAEAIKTLQEHPKTVVISGGSDVLIQIREGKLAGCSLVSIHNIQTLKGVSLEEDKTIRIGGATSFSHITNHKLIQKNVPTLGDALDQVGGPQIRNIGTIGGNICNGVTSADSAATLFTLNAKIELVGSQGKREIPIEKFYLGAGKTIRAHDEILTAILIPQTEYDNFYGHYIKYGKRNAMEIATLSCAVLVKLTQDKKYIEDIRIGFGVAAPIPMRCKRTEETIRHKKIETSLFEEIGKAVLKEVNPRSSWRASKEFRLQLVEELSQRALKEAIQKAGGKTYA